MIDRGGPRAGQQFGNYRLVHLLGQGGFAEVYLAQHLFLNTQAAIKILSTRLAQSEQESFLNEARTIAHLAHPHIVRVLDFGMQENSIPYLVMDYAPNGSLRERHPRGSRLPLPTILSYVNQISSALQYAHDEHLIHRDVKPENMLVGRNGEILLSDFGISIVTQTTQSQNTQEAIGTAPYMAPEQIQGKPRPASDQYALGIIVYEWLCGQRPFQGGLTELYGQQLFQPPPPLHDKVPGIPAEIERVIMTTLAKDPYQRFGSIQAFSNALEQASHGQPRSAVAASPGDMTAPAAIAKTVAAPPASFYNTPMTASTPPTIQANPSSIPVLPPSQPRTASRRVVLSGLAALGGLAVVGGVGGYIYTHQASTQGTPTPSPKIYPHQGTKIYTFRLHSDHVAAVAWSSDSTRIASGGADMTVWVWDATTGNNPQPYRKHTGQINHLSWSPNGRRFVSASSDGTAMVWDTSNPNNPLITYQGHIHSDGFSGVLAAAWSPDGKYIASGGLDGTMQVWDASNGHLLSSSPIQKSLGTPLYVYSIAWSPDSLRVASGASDGTVKIWDAHTGKLESTYSGHQIAVYAISWSPDGKLIASASGDTTVQVWQPSTQPQAFVFKGHSDEVLSVAWSPDGSRILSAGKDKTTQVWVPSNSQISGYIYKGHTDTVNSAVWASDSHRVASGSDDNTVQVWEAI